MPGPGVIWSVFRSAFAHVPGVRARLWIDHARAAARSSVTTRVRCTPEAAFDYVSDFSRHSEWTTGAQRIEQRTPGAVALGARLHAEGFQGGRWWPADLEVTRFERPSLFEFTATGGPVASPAGRPHRHTFTFIPDGDGSRLTLEREDPFSRWYFHLIGPLLVRATSGVRIRTVANLRDRLDQPARGA